MGCKDCEKSPNSVPFAAFESAMLRAERANRRLAAIVIILVLLLFGSNAAWLYYESQWEVTETTAITQDVDATDGGNAIINDGVHINGESAADGH